jgi:hypothetical protein
MAPAQAVKKTEEVMHFDVHKPVIDLTTVTINDTNSGTYIFEVSPNFMTKLGPALVLRFGPIGPNKAHIAVEPDRYWVMSGVVVAGSSFRLLDSHSDPADSPPPIAVNVLSIILHTNSATD